MEKKSGMAKYAASAALTVVVFLSLFAIFDFGAILRVIGRANMLYLALAGLVYACDTSVAAYRNVGLLKLYRPGVGFWDAMVPHFAGMFASDITPARSGYLIAAYDLARRAKVRLDRAMAIALVPLVSDILLKLVVTAAFLVYVGYWSGRIGAEQSALFAISAVAVLIATVVFAYAAISRRGLALFSFFERIPVLREPYYFLALLQKNSRLVLTKMPFLAATEAVVWVLRTLWWTLCFWALGLSISGSFAGDFVFFLAFHGAASLAQLIPIPTIAGSGLYELSQTALLIMFGIAGPYALAYGLVVRMLMLAMNFIFGFRFLVDFLSATDHVGLLQLDASEARKYLQREYEA